MMKFLDQMMIENPHLKIKKSLKIEKDLKVLDLKNLKKVN
jgi:hypothetical protein